MGKALDNELLELFKQAEAKGMCLVAPNERIRAALRRRIWEYTGSFSIVAPRKAIYAREEYWNQLDPAAQTLHVVRALAIKHPTWVFSDVTAAVVRGWNVSYALLEDLHLCATYHHRAESTVNHVTKTVERDIVDGVPVTSVAQTLFDCLRGRDLRLSLPIADSALHNLGLSPSEAMALIIEHEDLQKRKQFRHVLEVLSLADPRSESGGESVARAMIIALGFEVPELQAEYSDPMEPGRHIRADFKWTLPDGSVVLGELDGRQKYTDPTMTNGKDVVDVLREERLRESRLTLSGARIMRFSFNDACDAWYFTHLLDSYGVPRAAERLYRGTLGDPHVVRSRGGYDEAPPLECYADLVEEHAPYWWYGGAGNRGC